MNARERYLEFLAKTYLEILALQKRKNADYTGDAANPFACIEFAAIAAGVTPEEGLLVRIGDKIARIRGLLGVERAPQVDESLGDTVRDLIGYGAMFLAYLSRDQILEGVEDEPTPPPQNDLPEIPEPPAQHKKKPDWLEKIMQRGQ